MPRSRFGFLASDLLRKNVEETFQHLAHLLTIVKDSNYPAEAKSAFCKTIIVHTGSIIEALLFALLDERYTDEDIKNHYAYWQLKKPFHELHSVSDKHIVVAGQYKLTPGKNGKTKLNLSQICEFLKEKGMMSKDMHKKVEKVRNLRNEQHLATRKKLQSYTIKDVHEAFTTAREVKEFVRSELS